jgi:hypothetical protein
MDFPSVWVRYARHQSAWCHRAVVLRPGFDRPIALNELDHPIVVDFPLRGEWTVEQTPAHRIPSHGTDVLGMRYAYDFIRTDGRHRRRVHPAGSLRWFLVGGRTRDCYGWGEPVHAASAGQVVDAVDGVPERQGVMR